MRLVAKGPHPTGTTTIVSPFQALSRCVRLLVPDLELGSEDGLYTLITKLAVC